MHALGAAISVQVAQADTRHADCEVRKDGEKKKGKSGACTLGQLRRPEDFGVDLREPLDDARSNARIAA